MPVSIEGIQHVPLFSSLAREDLEQVAAQTIERQYERDDLILLEGEVGGGLHYVQTGLAKVFKTSLKGKEQVLRLIAPGYTFNDVPAIDGGPNPASAAAMETSTIYIISHQELLKLMRTRPEVANAVIKTFAHALRHMVALVEDLSLRQVTGRVARLLLDQHALQLQGKGHSRMLTQQEMAAMVGTAREVVGRSLKELETAGAITMQHGRVIVLHRDRLQLLASE